MSPNKLLFKVLVVLVFVMVVVSCGPSAPVARAESTQATGTSSIDVQKVAEIAVRDSNNATGYDIWKLTDATHAELNNPAQVCYMIVPKIMNAFAPSISCPPSH